MIQLEQVSKSFDGVPALQGLTLQVGSGEILGLLGANGAGKSTAIHTLLGFLKPDSGAASVDGLDCSTMAAKAREVIGYIPEDVSLYPYLSGLENLDYFCRLTGRRYSGDELRGFLTECGLPVDAHALPVAGYSKGMRQKVGIAIAYAKRAKVYLLDEPASGLDPVASNELSALLEKLAAEGAAMLMASHDIFRVREVCNRIGMLKQGELVKELAADEVTADELERLYLAYMQG